MIQEIKEILKIKTKNTFNERREKIYRRYMLQYHPDKNTELPPIAEGYASFLNEFRGITFEKAPILLSYLHP